ncbi:MAG: hypothetical protein ACT4N2_02580 [Hyphomicrobium sp.]
MTATANLPSFSLTGYRLLVRGILERGYGLRSFQDADPVMPHLVLRHDIDQCIATARRLSDLETENGWQSTWFVLVRTEMYNPFSKANVGHLREMIAAGHEVGLHLDATHYPSTEDFDAGARQECRMLEDITSSPVRIVSFHRPAPALIGSSDLVGGRIHTYMPRFINEMGYCSDSRGQWRHGFPWDHEAFRERRALQLLTHAIWWVGPDDREPRQRLADLVARKVAEYNAELAANNDVWRF